MQTAFSTPEHLLLMVGDPKQAIYRFRGGDLNTYKSASRAVERIDDLLDNRRTTSPLMKGMNDLMAPGLQHSELPVPAVTREPPSAHCRSAGNQSLQLLEINPEEDAEPTSRTTLEERIPAITTALILTTLSDVPELDPSDICILVSRHRQAEAIRRQLAASDCPVAWSVRVMCSAVRVRQISRRSWMPWHARRTPAVCANWLCRPCCNGARMTWTLRRPTVDSTSWRPRFSSWHRDCQHSG